MTGLTNGTAYTLALRAVNDSGSGAVSSIAAAPVAVPAPPSGLTAAAGDAQVTLSWTDPGNATIGKYQLSSDGGTSFADIPGRRRDHQPHRDGPGPRTASRCARRTPPATARCPASPPRRGRRWRGVPAAPAGLSAAPGDGR